MTIKIPNNLKMSLCLIGICSVSALSLAEESMFLFAMGVIAILSASFLPVLSECFEKWHNFQKIFPIICMLLMIADYFYISGKLVLALSHFLLLYEVFLFLSSNSEKKIWQIYLVSFLTVTAAASITDNFYFSVCFILYVFSAIYSLSLFRIHAEWLKNVRLRGKTISAVDTEFFSEAPPGKTADKNFFIAVFTASIVMVSFTAVLFLVLPRIGLGFMLSRIGAGSGMAGFSEESRIGDMGEILGNRSIVMRIKTDRPISIPELRMRGIAYDLFRDNIWKRSRMFNRFYKPFYSDNISLVRNADAESEDAVVQSVSLSSTGSDALFSLYYPVSIGSLSCGFRGILNDNSMSLFTPWPYYYLINYEVTSIAKEDAFYRELSFLEKAHYLDTEGLDRKIKELALSVAGNSVGFYYKAKRVEKYLEENMKYSRSVLSAGVNKDPLYNFIFITKKGHCEYFATALTLMCRAAGIPARYVNGFYGGEWNTYGSYYIVRQENAHSWTEIFVPERGWMYLDATPSLVDSKSAISFFASIGLFVDSLKMSWGKYVVGYDLNMQAKAAKKMNLNALQALRKFSLLKKKFPKFENLHRKQLFFIFILLIFIVLSFRALLKAAKKSRKALSSVGFYNNLIKIFEKNGYVKLDYLTGYEFISLLNDVNPRILNESSYLVNLFYSARYGMETITQKDGIEISEKLKIIATMFKTERR